MAQSRKLPYRCKDLADISYRSLVIAHFVTNLVAMSDNHDTIRLAGLGNHTTEPKITILSGVMTV